ncbi:Cell division control protein 3 [Venturia inaequalis]|nr:Cell division control protein 3 [Venturia inaequalis]
MYLANIFSTTILLLYITPSLALEYACCGVVSPPPQKRKTDPII